MDTLALITEAKQGSAAAQKLLFTRFASRMQVVCRRYVKSPEDAEELLLNGFFKFFSKIDSFSYQGEAALYAWLKQIMINECLMFLRSKNAFAMVTEAEAGEVGFSEDILDQLSADEILKLILTLPVGYRTVFNLYAVEGYQHAEIAGLLGISEGTSRSQYSKAKQLLQKILSQNEIVYVKRNAN